MAPQTLCLAPLPFAAAVFSTLALAAPPVEACDCMAESAEKYVADAEQVFLARAGADQEGKQGFAQTFEVLHPFKGNPGKSFTWTRSERRPLCGPAYQEGEVSILFVRKNTLGLCGGNFDLMAQLMKFRATVTAAGGPAADVALDPLKLALEGALKNYLHDRPRIDVRYTPLAGKKFAIGKSTLTISNSNAKKGDKNAIIIVEALTTGPLTAVIGVYKAEGYGFFALLLDQGKGPALLHAGGRERSR